LRLLSCYTLTTAAMMDNVVDITGLNRQIDELAGISASSNLARQTETPYVGGMATGKAPEDNPMDREYTDAKMETVRAQNDARFAEVMAKLEIMSRTSITKRELWTATGTSIAAILGVILAVLAFAGDRFDAGIGFSSQVAEQAAVDASQDAKFDLVIDKLDSVADRLEGLEARLPTAP